MQHVSERKSARHTEYLLGATGGRRAIEARLERGRSSGWMHGYVDRITSLCHSHARHEQGRPACSLHTSTCASACAWTPTSYITHCPPPSAWRRDPQISLMRLLRGHSRPAIRLIMHTLSIGNPFFFSVLRSLLSLFLQQTTPRMHAHFNLSR